MHVPLGSAKRFLPLRLNSRTSYLLVSTPHLPYSLTSTAPIWACLHAPLRRLCTATGQTPFQKSFLLPSAARDSRIWGLLGRSFFVAAHYVKCDNLEHPSSHPSPPRPCIHACLRESHKVSAEKFSPFRMYSGRSGSCREAPVDRVPVKPQNN